MESTSGESTRTGGPILVVDDEPAVCSLITTYLRQAGFQVHEAASGEAALEHIEAEAVGLVVMDMAMPGMTGIDVVRRLRERPETATLPIVLMTGFGGEYSLEAGLGVGADDYLTKPIRLDELVTRIEAHMRSERVAAGQAVQEREALYRLLVEQAADGILVSDRTGRYVEANPAVCRMLGYTRDEILATSSPGLAAADDPLSPEDMDVRLAATPTGTGLLIERRYRCKDGQSLPVEVNFTRLPDRRLQRNIRDITERRRAEATLRESERTLAEAQRIAHIGSWEWDLTTGAAHRSAETHRIFGVEPGAFPEVSEAYLAFVHPDDRTRVQASERDALERGTPHNLDYRIVRPEGSVRLVHEEGEVIRDAQGNPVRMVGTVQDLTEHRIAEAERTRLASAVEQTGDAIWMQDTGKVVTYVNPAFTRVYGYARDEIVGQHARILDSHRQDRPFFEAIWATVLAGRTWAGLMINRRQDGVVIELEAVISAMRDADGRLTGYVQSDRDVTRERALERATERDAREREAIEAALARIDPSVSDEKIAAAACTVISGLPEVDSTWVTVLDDTLGWVLAATGPLVPTFAPGRPIPASRVAYLRERGTGGPWFEEWRPRSDDGAWEEAITSTGLQAMAYAPLRGPRGVVGVVGIGSHDPARAGSLVEHLPALNTFASILGALLVPRLESRRRDAEGWSAIRQVLDTSAFTIFFQPIVDLQTGTIVGYEALSRFTDGVPPDIRFAAAGRAGLGIELEVATLRAAGDAAVVLPSNAYLSLNVSPELIHADLLGPLLAGLGRPVVLEITEHVAIDDYAALLRVIETLRPAVRLAVDDAGAGYASFRHILELSPRLVKLDIGLIRGIDGDPARQALLAGMAYFAVKRKIRLVAEGIETPAELQTLRSLGIGYGQGYLLGRPQDGRGPGPWPTVVALAKPETRPDGQRRSRPTPKAPAASSPGATT